MAIRRGVDDEEGVMQVEVDRQIKKTKLMEEVGRRGGGQKNNV